MKYKNPIIPGFHPDPSICRDGNDYYLVTSSFEYLPGVPLFHSTNMVDWEQIGHCLTRPSQIDLKDAPCSGGIFAPTIRKHEGRFYMITTNIAKGTFYVYSDDLQKGWSDPIFLEPMIKGIDPSFYFEDGRTYVQLSSFQEGIVQFEMDIETGKVLGEVQCITKGCGGRDVEAPHIYKINNFYYLLCAEGGTRDGHMVTIQRSEQLWGPYQPCPHNPILTNRDQGRNPLQGCGHGDLIEDAHGEWWMVALAYRPYKHKHVLGRETILLPVTWSKDGWPIVHKGYAECDMDIDRTWVANPQTEMIRDDFDEAALSYTWNYLRSFLNTYSLTKQKGCLTLFGNDHTLDECNSPAFIAHRQQHQHFDASTYMDVILNNEQDEAGMAIYMDTNHHMELGVHKKEQEYYVFVRKHVGEISFISKEIKIPGNTIHLRIQGNNTHYTFAYGLKEDEWLYLDETLCKHVSTEVADSAFTGVYIGMYAYHHAEAAYDWFDYSERKE